MLRDTMPADVALLVGGLVFGVAIGLATGIAGGARRRGAVDRAFGVGSATARHALRAALSPVIGLVSVNVALLVTNVILTEHAFNLPGFFRSADIGQFGYGDTPPPAKPSLDDVQALVVEAAFLIAVTMFLADVLRARLDPRSGARE